jgi:HEAT repeat protein
VRYEQLADSALTVLSAPVNEAPPDVRDGVMGVAATMIGLLRYDDEFAINRLLDILSDEGYSGDTVNNAIWALQQLGPAALKPCFDFVRYTSRDEVRDDVLEVVGVLGRDNEEVFTYLAQQLQETTWDNEKVRFAYPLSLLHDARAVPLIVTALRDPLVTDDDAWELLDALEELNVEFTTDESRHALNIAGYGVIENVLPTDWTPRAEREAEWDEEMRKMEEMRDAEESDADVVYDERGVPRCPDCGVEMQWLNGRWVHPAVGPRYDLPSVSRLTPPPPLKVSHTEQKVGRNDPCPCGSGKKYKHCHGKSLAVN